jgi:hypothetical protein
LEEGSKERSDGPNKKVVVVKTIKLSPQEESLIEDMQQRYNELRIKLSELINSNYGI